MVKKMQTSMLTQAFNYKTWADKRTLAAIKQINQETFVQSYRFVLQQINHTVIVEELFKNRLTHNTPPHNSTNTQTVPSLEELAPRLIDSDNWYSEYVSLERDWDSSISFVFADGKQGKMTISEILFHIITHGSYHRGNIAHALDLSEVPHPVDGYGIYIHEQEPERRKS